MSRCIQPKCKCTGYKEPPKAKNSLLQFRLSCQGCGHQASEHRKLTLVDHYIKSEVAAGKRARCTYRISPSDIPTSPVFSKYDIILIPTDEDACEALVKENTIPCTCEGFKVSDLTRLCQVYRTHCMTDVTSKLKDSLCSFCNHPLVFHSTNNQDIAKDSKLLPPHFRKRPILGPHRGLSLKASSKLAFSPANSSCLKLLMPADMASEFIVVAVGTFRCSEKLKLAVLGCSVITTSSESTAAVDKCVSSDADSMEIYPPDGSTVVPTSTPHMCGSNPSNREVKKGRNTTAEAGRKKARRSMRLATKTAKMEAEHTRRKLKGLKGAKRLLEVDSYEEEEEEERDDEDFSGERELVGEGSACFVNHLGKEENYRSYLLPQELLGVKPTSLMVAAVRSTCMTNLTAFRDVSQDARGSQDIIQDTRHSQDIGVGMLRHSPVLVAVGSKKRSDVFLTVVSIHEQTDNYPLQWLQVECASRGRLECLALNDASSPVSSENVVVSLVAGISCGLISVWTVFLERGSLTGNPILAAEIDCSSPVPTISCSPVLSGPDRLLAAGTILGDVLFCFLSISKSSEEDVATRPTSFPMVQRVHCSCAPINCITWSADGRLVAVGGSDDTIQVLQSEEPPKTYTNTARNCHTLLNYFKKTKSCQWPKFIHTHTLKGHSSFVADLTFSRGRFLTSLGWDSQLLFWKHLTHQRRSCDRVTKCRGGRSTVELVEPVGGYRLGPSTAVEFLPTHLCPLMAGCDFMVAMDNKLGGMTVASYTKSIF